jgi:HK97 gp10 family phage protein
MPLTVKITGEKELDRILSNLPKAFTDKVLVSAFKKAADPVVKAAKARVPVGNKPHMRYSGGRVVATYYPGNLQKSIGAMQVKDKKGNKAVLVKPRRGAKWKNDGYYAHLVEFGTSNSPAQPYMRPAFDSTKALVNATVKKEIHIAFIKHAKKLKR